MKSSFIHSLFIKKYNDIKPDNDCKSLVLYDYKKNKKLEKKNKRLIKKQLIKAAKKKARADEKTIAKFKNHWINIMANLKLYNSEKYTYSLGNIKVTSYGIVSDIRIVDGLNYSKLDDVKETIEDNLGCIVVSNKPKRSNIAHFEFIYTSPDKKKFEVPNDIKLKPYQLYIGNGYNSNYIIADMVKWPHILITGGTRSGKSKLIDCILTVLIDKFTPIELELYLIQVAKSDLILYEDVSICRGFATDLTQTETMLQHIVNEVMIKRDDRIKLIHKAALGTNYHDYNKLHPEDKIPTTYVVFDEMASLGQLQGCTAEVKNQKLRILAYIKAIAQYGASLGVFLIMSLQRPTKDNLDPFLKSQASFIVSFRQNNKRSSDVALDDPNMAINLEQREFIYHTNKYSYGMVPLIYDKDIYNIIKDKLEPGHRTIFSDFNNMMNNSINGYEDIEEDNEVTINEFIEHTLDRNNENELRNNENELINDILQNTDINSNTNTNINIDEAIDDVIARNIAEIPNFVPYEPIDENDDRITIIDETRPSNNTSRPRRNNITDMNEDSNENEESDDDINNIFDDFDN